MRLSCLTLGGAAALALVACAPEPAAEPNSQDQFWAALSSHCGNAYAGQLVSDDVADADFAGAEMVMHVRECSDSRIEVPFHVAMDGEWDRSRTWVFTRNVCGQPDGSGVTCGIQLKHDHRHEDGEPDAVTMYGGFGGSDGSTPGSQDFPVDEFSVDLFKREGLDASVTNVWTVEVDPAEDGNGTFAYQLKRTVATGAPEDRFFRVEFDLSNPVEAPPSAWGQE